MSEIVPAILSETTSDYTSKVEMYQSFASRLHVDICDGQFAPTFTIGISDVTWPASMLVDIHAMVLKPSEHVRALVDKRPNLIMFHAEVEEDLVPIFQFVRQQGIKAGLVLQKATVPASVTQLIQSVDHVMIFSGELGKHGGTASMMQLEKVRLIKAIRSDVEIGWDGGVLVDNAFSLAQGGIDVVNVGGAIANSTDPAAVYNELISEVNKRGVV